jgi:SAM-dependent methyltransferase
MVNRLREAGFRLPLRRIPHGADVLTADRGAARRSLAERAGWTLDDAAAVFGVFGFLKPYKRIRESLRAFARLRREYPAIKIVLVGEEHPHYPLRPLISELGAEDGVAILGHLPLAQFSDCMAGVDCCINLRRPTAGETSGSVMRALALGKPTLVSDLGSFAELPDDAVFKIPVDDKEEQWLYEYMRVIVDEPEFAGAVGANGRAYVHRTALWPQVAAQYAKFLAECAQGPLAEARVTAMPVPSNGRSVRAVPSEDELAEYIVGFSHASKVMEEYAQEHLRRLARTVQITPPGSARDRLLELGCYLQMTPAFSRYLGYGEVRGAYYGKLGEQITQSNRSVTGEIFTCRVDLFDAERDRFPYPDGHFQTVLCCELIEHLAGDPMHMMAEINRILASGGHLLLSTPNIVSFRSAHAVLHGYHPGLFPAYIKPSPDGGAADPRHNREYAPREVALLAEAAGFQVERLETGDYNDKRTNTKWVEDLFETNRLTSELRGEVIYCLVRKAGPVRDRWPKDLYYP